MSDATGPNPPQREAACEECGYCLHGHLAAEEAAAEARCPECSTAFDPQRPWRPKPWPAPWQLALRCGGPITATLALFLALSTFRLGRNLLVWPLWLIWFSAIVASGMFAPLNVARKVAREAEPRRTRRAASRRIAGPALVFSSAATLLALLGFFAML